MNSPSYDSNRFYPCLSSSHHIGKCCIRSQNLRELVGGMHRVLAVAYAGFVELISDKP